MHKVENPKTNLNVMWLWKWSTHHFIDWGDDLYHLLPRDVSVPIQVVHGEGPAQLLVQLAAGGDAQRAQELPEVDGPVSVGVKCPEHVHRKLGGVARGENVPVHFLPDSSSNDNKLCETDADTVPGNTTRDRSCLLSFTLMKTSVVLAIELSTNLREVLQYPG